MRYVQSLLSTFMEQCEPDEKIEANQMLAQRGVLFRFPRTARHVKVTTDDARCILADRVMVSYLNSDGRLEDSVR